MLCAAGSSGAQDRTDAVTRAAQARPLPGDRIFVHILRERLLSDTVTVDDRGRAAFPKLGVIDVSSMSVAQLGDSLRTRYAEYLRTPELEIVVLRRVAVHGEVQRPGVYLVEVSTTLPDIIARAGGFTEAAKRSSIRLARDGEVRDLEWGSASLTAAELHSGDQVVVGRRSWLSLNALSVVSSVALIGSIVVAATR